MGCKFRERCQGGAAVEAMLADCIQARRLVVSHMATFLITAAVIMLTLGLVSYFSSTRANQPPHGGHVLSLLPGDIKYESPSGNFRFYFPVTTSILISIVLTLVLWLLS